MRVDGEFPVVGSGGVSGTHISHNFKGPGIVIGRKGSYGSIHWIPTNGFAIDTAYFIDRRLTSAHLRWLYYALQAVDLRGASQDVGVPGLARETAYEVLLPVPQFLEEQCRIAEFLDTETARIDLLTSKKLSLLSLLEERIDSRILDLIGASNLAKSELSRSVSPIRRLLKKMNRMPKPDAHPITAFRDGQVTARLLRRTDGYTLPSSTEAAGQFVEPGDVVIHGLDGFAGAIGTSEASGNCSPVYHVCTPLDGGDPLFLGRLLRVLAITGYLGLFATSTRERAVDFRNWDLFGRIPIPQVPQQEQREIGAWISSIRPLRVAIDRSNALAVERRQALITAAVTGQFDVSTASGRNVTEGVGA
ncbi:hypothetical protein ACFO4E_13360 [Nocardiopsis mangrovi]|uniref:Type I restriction modification DNA specificity domain-containing protein n=1 Tax=Nocardiopsis mangrovi TaxID=1179818 RepID=A0ABV9DY41_9ACTN